MRIGQENNTENANRGIFHWLTWVFSGAAETQDSGEKSNAVPMLEEPGDCAQSIDPPLRHVVLSDTDNDVTSTERSLRFTGILNDSGELAETFQGVNIFHTGDLVDKKKPDFSVAEYWRCFQQEAHEKGYRVKFIAGNHEQEIWQKIRTGETYGKDAGQLARLSQFIESLDLFHVAGPVLFIHGYPTLEFLQTLLHFKEVTGKDLNCFNADHYKKAFKSINALKQYSYEKQKRQTNYLLYDLADARRYYCKQGDAVGAVLAQLKIGTVVHGHRPQRSGLQVDYEFGQWIPNIRMIGNDTMVKRNGIGATAIGETPSGELDIVFVNKKTESEEMRRRVQKVLAQ